MSNVSVTPAIKELTEIARREVKFWAEEEKPAPGYSSGKHAVMLYLFAKLYYLGQALLWGAPDGPSAGIDDPRPNVVQFLELLEDKTYESDLVLGDLRALEEDETSTRYGNLTAPGSAMKLVWCAVAEAKAMLTELEEKAIFTALARAQDGGSIQ